MNRPQADLPAGLRLMYTDPHCDRYQYEQDANSVFFAVYPDGTVELGIDALFTSMVPMEVLRWIVDLAERRKTR